MDLFKNASDALDYEQGATIFNEGDAGDCMYVVQSGEVDLKVGDHHLATIGEGAMLGEMAILDDSPRSATAVARTDARLVPVDQRRFLFLVQNTPFFAVDVMRVMAERLRMMDRRESS